MTITEFLLARIGEDEAAAERGGSHPDETPFARDNYGILWVQPARVLAECEAKRRIVEATWDLESFDFESDGAYRHIVSGQKAILAALALPYADHPDYDPAWSPDQ